MGFGWGAERVGGTWRLRALVAAFAWGAAASAVAQDKPTLDVQRFDPVSQKPGFSVVRDAEALDQWTFTAMVSANYALNPFELGNIDTKQRTVGVIDHLFGFDLGLGFQPLKWMHLGVDLPILELVANSDQSKIVAQELGAKGQGAGIGDLKVSVDFHPIRQRQNGKISFAIIPYVTIPTGTRTEFVGSGAFQAGGDLALGGRWKHIRFTASAGYDFLTPTKPVGTVLADDEFRWGLGLGVPFGSQDRFEVEAEWFGGAVVTGGKLAAIDAHVFDARHTPNELLIGFSFLPPDRPYFMKVGVGPGLSKGFGTPDFRAFIQIGGIIRAKDVGPPDADGDGLADPDDLCPSVPEDFDGFEDDDGCPEPDNDFDRILDVDDACPMDPEDYDTFEDTDGCPDPDNDKDTIPDVKDACMMDPEDFDGWKDTDGCPDPDNDFDTFLDVVDACPNDPEIINGIDDTDGCPDEALAQVDVDKEEIVILDKIYFEFDKAIIRPESYAVIDAVANVMRAYRDVALVEVQGHTDARANDAYNLDLSQRRAAAVVEALIARGIDTHRLVPRGYGESRLVVPDAKTEDEHARNRRVQFVILQRQDVGGPPVIDGSGDNAPTPGSSSQPVPDGPEAPPAP